jgi:3-oxoacyl-[acyl-carrier protein] reductase
MKLQDKVAVITGAGQGIGREFALSFAREGARIVIAEINFDKAQAVAEEIEKDGGQALAVKTDVTSADEAAAMAQKAADRFGGIDILLNNAAVFFGVQMKPFYEIAEEEWDRVMAVNVKGIWQCAKAVFPFMKERGKGKIINISSDTFNLGIPLLAHYVSSKGGVIGLTRALAKELGAFGINVNCINPGLTSTEAGDSVQESFPPGFIDIHDSMMVFKRREQPSDLVGAAIFFASEDSDFITGQSLVIDGGMTMH